MLPWASNALRRSGSCHDTIVHQIASAVPLKMIGVGADVGSAFALGFGRQKRKPAFAGP
jgi:hypothetical protein